MISPGDVINKIAENEGITVSALATSLGKPAANLYDIQSLCIAVNERKQEKVSSSCCCQKQWRY